jgi:hypothetical protein
MRATRRKKVEQRGGVHRAELSGELGRAPVSDSCGWEPYHRKSRRARDARGGGGARGEMQWLAVSGGGRDGQLRRGRARCGGRGERARALLLLVRGWSGGGVGE